MKIKRKDLVVGKVYKMLIPGNTGRFHSKDLETGVVSFQPVTGNTYIVDEDGLIRFYLDGDDFEEVED